MAAALVHQGTETGLSSGGPEKFYFLNLSTRGASSALESCCILLLIMSNLADFDQLIVRQTVGLSPFCGGENQVKHLFRGDRGKPHWCLRDGLPLVESQLNERVKTGSLVFCKHRHCGERIQARA